MANRAIDLLSNAYTLLGYPFNEAEARIYVSLAVDEVKELLDRLAELEGRPTATAKPNGGGVIVAEAQPMTPARLVERRQEAFATRRPLDEV